MEQFLTYAFYPFCALLSTLSLWIIAFNSNKTK